MELMSRFPSINSKNKSYFLKIFSYLLVLIFLFNIGNFIEREISIGQNIICVKVDKLYENKVRDKYISEIGFSSRYENNLLSTNYNNDLQNITVFSVSEKVQSFKKIDIIRGRFILDIDSDKKKKYIVIDDKTAINFFTTKDCIGKIINVNNEAFTIVGVFRQNDNIINKLSETEEIRAYVPYGVNLNNTRVSHNIYIKTKENAQLLVSYLKNLLGDVTIQQIYNFDSNYRLQLNKLKVSLLFVFIVFLMLTFKVVKHFLIKLIRNIEKSSKELYFKELILTNKINIFLLISITILYLMLITFIFKKIEFNIYIQPQIIPSRVINIQEFLSKLTKYFVEKNNRPILNDYLYFVIYYYGELLSVVSILIIIIICRLKTLLRKVMILYE